jgi:cardiolipin synthase
MYLLSIAAARSNVRLATAYFVPDRRTIDALLEARRRGVSVQIIVPGPRIDEKFVRRASRAVWGDMLKAGVEIYEYQPTMYHCKLMIVDDRWVSIGSSNLDNRSFRLNDEANLNVLDAGFAAEQVRMFEQDLKRSKSISYEQWKKRPWHEKLAEGIASMFGPQL